MNYESIVKEIINIVGGENNIVSHTSCMTRLRITVKNNQIVNTKELENVEGVLGINENGQELQLIFGPGKVEKARSAMDKICLNDNNKDADEEFNEVIKQQKGNIKEKRTTKFQQFMAKFSNIFVPLIPGFIAAGTLAGFAGLLTSLNMSGDYINYLNIFNKSLMGFLFIMVGYNASKAFEGSGVLGAILAGLFTMSYTGADNAIGTIDSGMQSFYFINEINPHGGMIGVLISAIISAKLEVIVRKKFSWEATDIITTPIIVLLIMGIFTFGIVMPISSVLFDGMSWAFLHLNSNPLGAGVLAGLFLPSVMMGIHQGFVPVYSSLVESVGYNTLFPILAMAGAGQVGASLALYVKAPKDSKLRKNIRGAIIPGFLGIGEPLIYGVTLPRVKPFFTSMVAGAIGGVYVGFMSMIGYSFGLNTVFGSSGLLGTFAMTSDHGIIIAILLYLSALVVTYIAGFILTYLFGTKNVDLS